MLYPCRPPLRIFAAGVEPVLPESKMSEIRPVYPRTRYTPSRLSMLIFFA
jgi:hypothetical protein